MSGATDLNGCHEKVASKFMKSTRNEREVRARTKNLLRDRSGLVNSIGLSAVVLEDKKLLFDYLPYSRSLRVSLHNKGQTKYKSRLIIWTSPVTITPVRLRRSKDVVRFYFSRAKSISIVKFSLKAMLAELDRRVRKTPAERVTSVRPIVNRVPENPILTASAENKWESRAVFNSGTVYLQGKVHFIYRAIGESGLSVFGYASSKDGIHIDERSTTPAFVSDNLSAMSAGALPYPYSSGGSWWGSEDPRLTRVGDTVFMTYTAFDGVRPPGVALTSIAVNDFLNRKWNWKKPVMISEPGKINKNWVVFPEKIQGKYAILHSLTPTISVDYRTTLDFHDHDFIKSSYSSTGRDGYWDNWMRGVGSPPIDTAEGWLILYHAMDKNDPDKYKLGAMLVDKNHPEDILYRSAAPLLEPDEWYENNGFKRGVIYNCGAILIDGKLIIYYGGADTFICAAWVELTTLLTHLKQSQSSPLSLRKQA
jgi:predicted GH43/DUF377 family glycosyl hydrolase